MIQLLFQILFSKDKRYKGSCEACGSKVMKVGKIDTYYLCGSHYEGACIQRFEQSDKCKDRVDKSPKTILLKNLNQELYRVMNTPPLMEYREEEAYIRGLKFSINKIEELLPL